MKNPTTKRLFLISPYNFALSTLGLFGMVLCTSLLTYFLLSPFPEHFMTCLQTYWPIFAFLGCIWVVYFVVFYKNSFEFCGIVTISESGFSFHAPFHKVHFFSYAEINDIGIDYGYLSVYYQFWIYICKGKLPKAYIHRINRLPMNRHTMRVQFSQSRMEIFLSFLPSHLSKQLKKGESVLKMYRNN